MNQRQVNILDDTSGVPKKTFNPFYLLVLLTITVFVMELIIMLGIEFFISPETSVLLNIVEAIFDATLLTIVVFPVLYWFSFRPLVLYINDHHKIEQVLKTSNALLENTFASMHDVVLMVSVPDHSIITCNRAAEMILGYGVDELTGQNLSILYTDTQIYEAFLKTAAIAFRNGRFYEDERQIRRKDGRVIDSEMTVTQINNDTGATISQVIVIRDITRRKRDKAQLERHNQELQTLSQLGQTVVSSLELDSVLAHVIEQVMPLLNADYFSILLLDGTELVNYGIGGNDPKTTPGIRTPISDDIIAKVLKDGEPLKADCSGDVCALSSLDQAKSCGYEPHALMLAPLKVGDETIGLIQAVNENVNSFGDNDLKMLQSAANWAAIAISHARKHEEIQRRLQETATLAAVNQSLNETFELDNILQLIADSTPRLLKNVDRVVIHLLEEEEDILYPAIWSGESQHDTNALYMNSKEGIAGRAITTGKLINVPNVEQNPYYLSYSLSPQFKSLMVAPLQSGINKLGTISVHCNLKESAFSERDERLLMRFANSAAIAISTAKLYQAERHQRQFAESLAQAAAALNISLNLNEIIQTILTQTLLIVPPSEKATIFLLEDGKIYLTRSTDDEEIPPIFPETLHRIFIRQNANTLPHAELIAETGKPILITGTEEVPDWQNEPVADWMKSFVAAPLRIRNEIIGFLNVHSAKLGAFNQETIRQVEALAAHAALAVHNATLYKELKVVLQKEQSTRAQLVQAQKLSAMGRMVASVAHELNNPLQTIQNCLFLIQQDVDEETQMQTYIDMALSESKRLANLVSQLR
ncbi:MAG: GAF domain-containing protein, partial [Anaerolineae bacterium]|nr:GAF domain-containing protein [Anaerolineae bacterium]